VLFRQAAKLSRLSLYSQRRKTFQLGKGRGAAAGYLGPIEDVTSKRLPTKNLCKNTEEKSPWVEVDFRNKMLGAAGEPGRVKKGFLHPDENIEAGGGGVPRTMGAWRRTGEAVAKE